MSPSAGVAATRVDAELAPQLRALGANGTLPQLQGGLGLEIAY